MVIHDIYFEALQSLSPSRWILYEHRTLDEPHDLSELKEIYRSLLSDISSKEVCENGSIQVTGPAGYGKSSLVKLLSQDIRQRSSVVVIENFLGSCERLRPTLYGVYVSSIHQIISQRPSLFLPVQNLMIEILRQETWTEESIWILLSAILQHSRAVNFLIVIYDFEDWPSEIRSWWSETLGPLVKSFGSSFTFLISSHRPINNLTSEPPHELNLEMEYERYREDFIRVKTNNLLDHAFGLVIDPQGLSDNVKKKIMSKATSFQGSFTAINTYLVLLFQNFTLNTLDAIVNEIESSPETEERIYEREITTLRMKSPRVFSWASSAVSWMLSSIRQLRIEELGAAVAVSLNTSSLTNLRSGVSTDMERDLQNHLGHVVTIENRYARITSALTKEFLSRDETRHSLGIQNDSGLTRLCLHYVTLVLEDTEPETWQKCLSRISWKYKTPAPQDPAFEFLHYACRFWPTHFLLIKEPESSLKDAVIKFLLAPEIGERWFQLYQLCIPHSANLLIGDQEARGPAIAVPEAELTMFRRASLVRDAANIDSQGKAADARQMAVRMAGYIGLASIIPEILGGSVPARGFRMINVRRGYSQRAVAFSDSDSQYYLDCAIYNDDDNLVKELLDSDRSRIPKYFPLHKAAQAGCFKTVQTLFNKLEHPAETNEDGRTPLHQAAIGGSTKIIRFILGKDTFDTRSRRIDVPNMIDIKDCKSQTPLIIAIRMGNIEAAELLIESGADLAIRDDAGKTALHYAVFNCSETVQDFVTPDLARTLDDGDCTLLHTAAISGNMQTISTLISALRRSHYLKTAINTEDSQGKTPLLYAAEYGYTEIVKTLLINEASMELDDETYQQAANIAAKHGHLDTVKFFISADEHIRGNRLLQAASSAGQLLVVEYLLHNYPASLDSDQSLGPGPISLAASKGHNEVVRTLLRYNVSVNIEDDTGQTPLHHAAKNGRCRVMRTLLHHHANVDAPDMEGNTPLHSAAMAGRVRVIELLIHHAADLEARSRTEETALHLAVKSRKSVEALLKAGAKRDAIDRLGQTPLHIAAREECYQSVDLLRCPENINARDYDGRLPLYHAIIQKDLEKVKALRPDLLDSEDRIHLALEWAVQSSAPNVLDLLLNIYSESVNEPDGDGRTIIHMAAELESLEVLTILLEAKSKPDVNLTCEMERTPLHYAAIKGRVKNMRYLVEKGAEVDKADKEKQTPLHMAAINDEVEAVAVLLEEKADIDLQDSEQQTPLFLAACYGCVDVVKRLLEENADVKLVSSDGWSPLHAAADNPEIAEMLIAHEADVNLPKQDMWTPLHLATYWSELAVAKLLVEKGANLDVVTDDGNTALHLAIIGDNASLVQLILEKGANFKIKTKDGLSCLVLAVSNSSVNTLDILLDAGKHSRSGTVWDFEDVAAAYWQAIEEQDLEALQVLVKKEGQLPDELSDEGFTGLETCLRNRRDWCEEEPVAIFLLELGANPFKRRQVDQKSGFELGIISRREPKLKFMDACLERVPEDLSSSTSYLGFKELRIATELHKLDLWKRLEPLREAVSAEMDHDGWSLDHFIHQSADRLPIQPRTITPLKPTRSPTGLVVRPMWLLPVMETETLVKIASSRLQVSFTREY